MSKDDGVLYIEDIYFFHLPMLNYVFTEQGLLEGGPFFMLGLSLVVWVKSLP